MNDSKAATLRKAVYSFLLQEVVSGLGWEELEQAILNRQQKQNRAIQVVDILPILTCMALQGEGKAAIPLAAMWILYLITGRIVDDVQDNNHHLSHLNVGLGALACTPIPLSVYRTVNLSMADIVIKQCSHAFAQAARSQAEEWAYTVPSKEQYFENIYRKSGHFFGTAAWSGGCVSSPSPSPDQLQALYNYGFSIGIMTQIEDDCEDLAEDIEKGFFTLPVIYAISDTNHSVNTPLNTLLSKGTLSGNEKQTIVEFVMGSKAISMSLQVAWLYKAQAQDSLKELPDSEVKQYLKAYVT